MTDPGQQDEPEEPVDDPAVNGDLNGDGVIDEGDGDAFAEALGFGMGEDGFIPELDFDGDGQITLVDLQIWNELVFGSEP